MRIPKQHILLVLLLIALAFFLRVRVLVERAGVDETFFPPIGDIATYYWGAQAVVRGESVLTTFQPAIRYYFALGMLFMRDDNPYLLAVWTAWMDALMVGIIAACGWLLTRRWWAGQMAGLLFAVYPLSVFYATVLMIEGFATSLSLLFFCLWLWQRERLAWWRSLALGVLAGVMVHTRLNLAPLLGVYLLWLWATPLTWRTRLAHGGAALAVTLGLFVAIYTPNPVGYQLYSANNRDGDGTGGSSPAYATVDIPMEQAIWRDIALDPVRFGGLLLRKLAIAWSNAEVANVANYPVTRALSPTLQALTGDFTPLAVFGLLGLVALWRKERSVALGFAAWLLLVTLGIVVSFALSRFRHPITPALMLLSVYGALALAQDAARGVRAFLRAWGLPLAAVGAAVLLFPAWALGGDVPPLPPKRTYAELPADARPIGAVFADTLELVGWRALPDYWQAPARGYAFPNQAYTIELFWRLLRPTPHRYSVTFNYAQGDTRLTGIDYPIGEVAYPPVHTYRWQVDTLYAEILGFLITGDEPQARSGEVRVGVYYTEDEDSDLPYRVNLQVTTPYSAPYVVLDTLAVYAAPVTDAPAAPLRTFSALNGDTLTLLASDLPDSASAGETLTLRMTWAALGDVRGNYRLFLHVGDAQTPVITQGDGLPIADLLTSNWLPFAPLTGELRLPLPDRVGTYTVYYGLIDEAGERMTTDAPDNRPALGEITLR